MDNSQHVYRLGSTWIVLEMVLQKLTIRAWFVLWLALLALALTLTLLVKAEITPDEAAVVRDVQAWPFPGQTLSGAVRTLTGTEIVVVVGVLLAGLHWLLRARKSVLVLLVLTLVMVAAQAGLKDVVDRPRPSEAGIEMRASATSPSFPAGHLMGPVAIYGWAVIALARAVPNERRGIRAAGREALRHSWLPVASLSAFLLSFLLLVLAGIANVWLGVHWPTDVIGGYLWGGVLLVPAVQAAGSPSRPR